MFGRRGPRPFPVWLRAPIGALFLAIGILLLLAEAGVIEGAERENIVAGIAAGVCAAALGAMLLLGVFTGVGDLGERPARMRVPVRIVLDAFGYIVGFGLVALFAFIGLTTDWGGAGGLFPRFVFCGLALLFGAPLAYALGRAIWRAVRGLPYDDDQRPLPPDRG